MLPVQLGKQRLRLFRSLFVVRREGVATGCRELANRDRFD